jgi:hypothetical protein
MRNPHGSLDRFTDDHGALDFVASQIVDEAQRDGVQLSEVERKMLYFSETAWTLPDIWEVNDEFDKEYEQDAYEKKISGLIKKAVTRARKQQREDYEAWTAAIRRLSKDDRYLLVMVKQAGVGRILRPGRRSGDLWRICSRGLAAVALLAGFAGFTWVLLKVNPQPGGYSPRSGRYTSPLSEAISFSIWAFPFCMIIVYGLLRMLLGAEKVGKIYVRTIKWIFGKSNQGE